MNYEVIHGEYNRILSAGNPWQACLSMLREEATDDNMQEGPFSVLPLVEGGTAQEIEMSEIIAIQHEAVNGDEEEGKNAIAMNNLPDDFWDWS